VFFSVGTSGQYLVYDKSGIIDGQGNERHDLYLVNLATGQQTKLSASDLSQPGSGSDASIHVTINGQTVTIPLGQW
jgi:hypothetical protein